MNIRNLMRGLLGSILLAFVGTGCVGTQVNIKEVPVSQLDLSKGRAVRGCSTGFQLLLFIPINVNGRQAQAYEALLRQAHGDYVTDVKMQERWTYGFVGTAYSTVFTATAYPAKKP